MSGGRASIVDWRHAPLSKSVSPDLRLTLEEGEALAGIAGGLELTAVDQRLAAEGRRLGETLVAIWTKWRAMNEVSELRAAAWRRRWEYENRCTGNSPAADHPTVGRCDSGTEWGEM